MSLRDLYPAPLDFSSDGCTVPRILKPLYQRYADACRWHDWARRHLVHHKVITVHEADWEFRQDLKDMGMRQPLVQVTWLVVKWARGKYSATLPVPKKWESYLSPIATTGDETNAA